MPAFSPVEVWWPSWLWPSPWWWDPVKPVAPETFPSAPTLGLPSLQQAIKTGSATAYGSERAQSIHTNRRARGHRPCLISIKIDSSAKCRQTCLFFPELTLVDTSDLGLKVLQRNSGENGVLVNNRGIVDLLVDGDGGVNVGVLDGLL